MEPDSRESALINQASEAMNRIERLQKLVIEHGDTFIDKFGVVRPSPLLCEIRQQQTVLKGCLAGISMYDDDSDTTEKSQKKQAAGQASWRARRTRAAMKGVQ